jgi:hypothetical protein
MTFCDSLQLEMPDLFPVAAFEQFMTAGRSLIPAAAPMPVELEEFLRASNLIGWRFRACNEYHGLLLESWKSKGAAVSLEEVYRRQHWLFGMFVCGVSAVESTCYACFAASAAHLSYRLTFNEHARRDMTPKKFAKQLAKYQQANKFVNLLNMILDSEQWRLWGTYRNMMTHRSPALPIIRGALGGGLPPSRILDYPKTWSTPELNGDLAEHTGKITWLAGTLEQLLSGAVAMM